MNEMQTLAGGMQWPHAKVQARDWLGSSPAQKDMDILMDKLNMNQ